LTFKRSAEKKKTTYFDSMGKTNLTAIPFFLPEGEKKKQRGRESTRKNGKREGPFSGKKKVTKIKRVTQLAVFVDGMAASGRTKEDQQKEQGSKTSYEWPLQADTSQPRRGEI